MTIDLSRTAPSLWTLVAAYPGGLRTVRTFTDRASAEFAYREFCAAR